MSRSPGQCAGIRSNPDRGRIVHAIRSQVFMIIKPGQLSIPSEPAELFGREGPFVLEIGFGDGRYLGHLGHTYPGSNILGVEVSMGSMWRAYRRMKRERLENVRLFHGNARFVVRDVVKPGALSTIYVNFPDPWPRKRHHGNRLLRSDFFSLASTRLENGGVISLTTDHEEYFEFARTEATQTGFFEIEQAAPAEPALQTKYALKWRELNKPIFHALFHKVGEPEFEPTAIRKIEMQHAVLSGELKAVGHFEKQVSPFDGGHVIVLEAFRALSGDGLLFKVIVEEPDLRQEVLVQAWQKEDGVFVGLEQFGDPLGTRGVREAVRTVANWLEMQGLELKESWI